MQAIVKKSHKKLDPTDKNMLEKKSSTIFESLNSSPFSFPFDRDIEVVKGMLKDLICKFNLNSSNWLYVPF
jgi:hypothetical protein